MRIAHHHHDHDHHDDHHDHLNNGAAMRIAHGAQLSKSKSVAAFARTRWSATDVDLRDDVHDDDVDGGDNGDDSDHDDNHDNDDDVDDHYDVDDDAGSLFTLVRRRATS